MNSPDSIDRSPRDSHASPPGLLAEHFFRHQSGRLVSTLTRVLGTRHIDLVEDVVQGAFLQALRSWSVRGVPTNPEAWLLQVARNLALDNLRRDRVWRDKLRAQVARGEAGHDSLLEQVERADEISDDQLRMLFLCCHPELPEESRVALALKMLGGFSAAEIAKGLLTTEANAQKRLSRARERLRAETSLDVAPLDIGQRLPSVQSVIYLLFNEGYNSCQAERLIRVDLCNEALRLGELLARHEACRTPSTCALMALMSFHAARFAARESEDGALLLLDQQDRTRWDGNLIRKALGWMVESATGDALSTYHLEAGIAAEHSLAESFSATNWVRILQLYELLVAARPTPIHRLNRGIAIAYVHGPQAGLNALLQVDAKEIPRGYYLWDAALGELHRRAGHLDDARRHLQRALEQTKSRPEQDLLRTRLLSTRRDRGES